MDDYQDQLIGVALIKDSDIIVTFVTRAMLFSAAFQHSSALECDDHLQSRVSHLSHVETLNALANLAVEIERIKEDHRYNITMARIPAGEVLSFDKEYFAEYVLTEKSFLSRHSHKSNLSSVIKCLSTINQMKSASLLVDGKHYILLSGITNHKSDSHRKPFWVLKIEVKQILLFCLELVR